MRRNKSRIRCQRRKKTEFWLSPGAANGRRTILTAPSPLMGMVILPSLSAKPPDILVQSPRLRTCTWAVYQESYSLGGRQYGTPLTDF